MEQTINELDGIRVITLSGRFDSTAAQLFDAWFEGHDRSADKRYLLDIAEVPYITSAGLRSILKVTKLLDGRGGSLALCCVSAPVQDLFKIAGFTAFLKIYATREAALEALTG